MLTETRIVQENVRIQGAGRMLQGILAYPGGQTSRSALIAGPHPFLGGDMRNNVVSALLRALASQGAVTLAFNYAGVGTSEGGSEDWPSVMSTFWKDGTVAQETDWVEDTGTAMTALGEWADFSPVLVGYSFGCSTVVANVDHSCPAAIVLISPNPKHHEFKQLSTCMAPLLVLHSDNDFTCSISEIRAWFESIREPKTRIRLSAGEHFFVGHEPDVTSAVLKFLRHQGVFGSEPREDQH